MVQRASNPAESSPSPPSRPTPVLLLILDGFGYREAAPDNAISLAQCPHWRRLWAESPHALLRTDGPYVGLPEGQMGNSEVGHMNLGAGRIAYPELTRIELAVADGSFYRQPELVAACQQARQRNSRLHVLGLLSTGGVHSHQEQIFAFLDLAQQQGVDKLAVHAFLDGRDTPPRSAEASLRALQARLGKAQIGTVGGRFFGMDRDHRWERVAQHWQAIVDAQSAYRYADSLSALQAAYARGESDEFVTPSLIGDGARVEDGDVVVFMNFRADRARQLTQALVLPEFHGFARARWPRLARMVTLTQYQAQYLTEVPVQVAYEPPVMPNTLGEVISALGLRQLRIAETEKYAHVTFFFSGGREAEYPGEARILVPSPKVKSYDMQPEMSCPEVTARLVAAIRARSFDLLVCNLANPDMVGHTGNLAAAIKAVEAVDQALGAIRLACEETGTELLLTADHGNLEDMWDEASNQPNTQHSTHPVPLVYLGRRAVVRNGALQDVAPTILQLMGQAIPSEMSGRNLLDLDGSN